MIYPARVYSGLAQHTLYLPALIACLLFLSTTAVAQGNDNARLCNLQARELSLRVSEDMSSAFDAEQRQALAILSEEVCLDYFNSGLRPGNLTESKAGDIDAEEATDEEGAGLFGDIRMIDPQDRVRRPGLKRR